VRKAFTSHRSALLTGTSCSSQSACLLQLPLTANPRYSDSDLRCEHDNDVCVRACVEERIACAWCVWRYVASVCLSVYLSVCLQQHRAGKGDARCMCVSPMPVHSQVSHGDHGAAIPTRHDCAAEQHRRGTAAWWRLSRHPSAGSGSRSSSNRSNRSCSSSGSSRMPVA